MGVDYSFVLHVPQERIWDVLQDVAAMQQEGEEKIELIFPDHKLTLPFTSHFKSEPIVIDESVGGLSFDTSLCFEPDDVLLEYVEEQVGYERSEDEKAHLRQCLVNMQGQIMIGYIYLSIDFYANDRELVKPDAPLPRPIAKFSFQAATGRMNDLFEQSPSMQQAFLGLAAKHDGEAVLLDREEGDSLVLWLQGQPMKEEIPAPSVSICYYSPEDLRELIEQRIGRN